MPDGVADVSGQEKELEADTVIMSVGFRPLPSMKEELESLGIDIYQVGDGRAVGSIMTAIWEALWCLKPILPKARSPVTDQPCREIDEILQRKLLFIRNPFAVHPQRALIQICDQEAFFISVRRP